MIHEIATLRAGFLYCAVLIPAFLTAAPVFAQRIDAAPALRQFLMLSVRKNTSIARIEGVEIVFQQLGRTDDLDEDDERPGQPIERAQIRFHGGTLDDLIFGHGYDASLARARLERVLRQKIETATLKHDLNVAQQNELRLLDGQLEQFESTEVRALLYSKALRGEKALLVCSERLTGGDWKSIELGHLLIVPESLVPTTVRIR